MDDFIHGSLHIDNKSLNLFENFGDYMQSNYKWSEITETSTECQQQLKKEERYKRKNLIIWDWDDTIFPTYSFRTHQDKKDKEFMPKLVILVSLIEKIFVKMIKIYGADNIIIVTNGSESWINKCLNVDIVQDIFMKFQNLLKENKIKTLSASTKQIREKYPTNHFKWKQVVFTKCFKKHFYQNQVSHKMINCITSIGDSLCEYKASDISSKYLSNRVLNRIRFKPAPSINDMIFELKEILLILSEFGVNTDDIELDYSSIFIPTDYSSYSDSTC